MTMNRILITFSAIILIGSCNQNTVEPPVDCSKSDLAFVVTITDTNCGLSTGVIEVTATAGVPPYSYSLGGGAAQQQPKFDNLGAGEYIIKVTDSQGCTAEMTALVENKNGLSVSVSTTNSDCGATTGTLIINASNGVQPYQYQLDSETPQASPYFIVGPGIYNITVTDVNGCELVLSQQVKSNTSYATDVQLIIANSCNVTGCHDGSNSTLPNFSNFSEVQANASMIKSRTQSGNMPKTGSLTQEQKDIIACWVDDGAQDN